MDQNDLLDYARELAAKLKENMHFEQGGTSGYWQMDDSKQLFTLIATVTQALELLRVYAGPDSFWVRQAHEIYQNNGEHQSRESGARAVGDLLIAWTDQVEHGVVEMVGERTRGEVAGARMDLMEQVRQLLQDKDVHPAAPIVLCGAALEIALRAVAQVNNVVVADRPTFSNLIAALRRAKVITVQDVKDLEQCAGLRNLAAHGDFDDLSRERAGLMEQQTSILLRRLAELPAVAVGPA